MNPSLIAYANGIYLSGLDLWLDATAAKDFCVVSHAHSDHMARHRLTLATPATARLMGLRNNLREALTLPYGQPWEGGRGYRITLFPAGHCLGSAQVLIEEEESGKRILYTGDFKLRPNPTAESAPIVPCDVLIMDSTYGHPRYVFPPDEEVLGRLYGILDGAFTAGEVPVILAYPLGKSQELLKHLLGRGYQVVLHRTIYSAALAYQHMGVDFGGSFTSYNGETLKGEVLIMPPHLRKSPSLEGIPHKRLVMLSGWAVDKSARYRFKVDEALPFSDHGDFPALVHYVKTSSPQRVYTLFGFRELSSYLVSLGYDAWHLTHHQMPLPLH